MDPDAEYEAWLIDQQPDYALVSSDDDYLADCLQAEETTTHDIADSRRSHGLDADDLPF